MFASIWRRATSSSLRSGVLMSHHRLSSNGGDGDKLPKKGGHKNKPGDKGKTRPTSPFDTRDKPLAWGTNQVPLQPPTKLQLAIQRLNEKLEALEKKKDGLGKKKAKLEESVREATEAAAKEAPSGATEEDKKKLEEKKKELEKKIEKLKEKIHEVEKKLVENEKEMDKVVSTLSTLKGEEGEGEAQD